MVLPAGFPQGLLGDSKKLGKAKREAARAVIMERALGWGAGWASHAEIDEINILQASLLAMRRAWEAMLAAFPALASVPLEAIVDGLHVPDIPVPCRALVRADSLVPQVMAASIMAKTERDREMDRYAALYPRYGYEKHRGYPTKAHREAILRWGPSPIQRLTFHVTG